MFIMTDDEYDKLTHDSLHSHYDRWYTKTLLMRREITSFDRKIAELGSIVEADINAHNFQQANYDQFTGVVNKRNELRKRVKGFCIGGWDPLLGPIAAASADKKAIYDYVVKVVDNANSMIECEQKNEQREWASAREATYWNNANKTIAALKFSDEETTAKATQRIIDKQTRNSFTGNAISAGYRVGATQLTLLVKTSILTIMRNKNTDNDTINGMSAFLNTEVGAALISFALGTGFSYASENEHIARLAEELQVNGMATCGNAIINEVMQHMIPAARQILQNLPAASLPNNVRVDTSIAEEVNSEEELAVAADTSHTTNTSKQLN